MSYKEQIMTYNSVQDYIKNLIKNLPSDWLNLTTHRLDIYNENLAKVEFIEAFENLFAQNNFENLALKQLPTAYDYIRLGHPLSCVLEWAIAKSYNLKSGQVISFSSEIMPVLAILRKNLLDGKNTIIFYDELPKSFDVEVLKNVYGYKFDLKNIRDLNESSNINECSVFVTKNSKISTETLYTNLDFQINIFDQLGSVILINSKDNPEYISEIQHVRRRETIAMTPDNCLKALKVIYDETPLDQSIKNNLNENKTAVLNTIQSVAGVNTKPLVGSSGLSIQYAIMMGLVHYAQEHYKGKAIKFVVPPNCYGGTNDQARRLATCFDNVEIIDLPVDGNNDMVNSVEQVLNAIAEVDAVPYIIAEIPTNPRVEVPELDKLKIALEKKRITPSGNKAIEPVFILDQTFCPNVHFLAEGNALSEVKTIAYVSGSKFPSGGKCTAGYCIGNANAETLIDYVERHLMLCDNEATALQIDILAKQMPSMIKRISDAYQNTREFVTFIENVLPTAKINFVSEVLANEGFTPSVFSLDLPTKGKTAEEKEAYKRTLNHKLINAMITKIPEESKYCVSYGQLKGCYWTIPATSTQGTTKEDDKDYIARVALSPKMDLEHHKAIFQEFVNDITTN